MKLPSVLFSRRGIDVVKERIQSIIGNSGNQLQLTFQEGLKDSLYSILFSTNYRVHQLKWPSCHLLYLLESTESLSVKNLQILSIDRELDQLPEILEKLSKVVDCESISFDFIEGYEGFPIDDFSLFTSLLLQEAGYNHLHHVQIHNSSITDVTMLGNIPHLELTDCGQLVDISSLNNNDRVSVNRCKSIQDYSKSFANSRRIEIRLIKFGSNIMLTDGAFDFSRWVRVEYLLLSCWSGHLRRSTHRTPNNKLPKTVKKCYLNGDFITFTDFTVTPEHALNEVVFLLGNSITSLKGYGLERVAIVELLSMNGLESLEGLGGGRNRKVMVQACHNIKDFTPLKNTAIVGIEHCSGFSDLVQVRYVRDLTLAPIREMRFSNDVYFENIESLSLSNIGNIEDFTGLKHIRHLELDNYGFDWIEKFLKRGNKPENQRIVLKCIYEEETKPDTFLDIHNRYLKDDYDYYNMLPKKGIWVRKN